MALKSDRLSSGSHSKPSIHLGCAGWTIPREFASRFAADGSHLERYSRVLNCAEINSSFYRPHKEQTWERWNLSVPANFLFSIKAPKAITHESKLNCSREELIAFLHQLKPLSDKLGPLLFQLPPSFEFDKTRATKFLAMLREFHSGDVAWEPRNESWFTEEADGLLKAFKISRVAADPARIPSASSPAGWRGLSYYRLHGSPRTYWSAYTSKFLDKLAHELVGAPSANVWCIFDNTASGAAAGNVLELAQFLEQKLLG